MRERLIAALWLSGVSLACNPDRATWDPCVVPAIPDGAANQVPAVSPNGELEGYLPDGAVAVGLNTVDRSTCAQPFRCVSFSTLGEDGQCHSTSPVCAVPCRIKDDCADLGLNVVCSSLCNTVGDGDGGMVGICTPLQ